MPRVVHNFVGRRFGRWSVISRAGSIKSSSAWQCRCDCGIERVVPSTSLGAHSSCGCYRRDIATTHGMRRTSIHRIWGLMIQRCHNEKNPGYYKYGARGISVCARWRASFEMFFRDMGDRPSHEHSIERTNNDGNYEPGNCVWASYAAH